MLKKTIWIGVILLLVSTCGIAYLFHHRELSKYSPELDRLIRSGGKQAAAAWRSTEGIREAIQDKASRLEVRSTLKRYLPHMEGGKGSTSRRPDDETEAFGILNAPRPSKAAVPETVYTWVDRRGVRHFSNTKPTDTRFKIETIRQ